MFNLGLLVISRFMPYVGYVTIAMVRCQKLFLLTQISHSSFIPERFPST